MSPSDRLKQSPVTFRRLTGITSAAFERLLADLTPRYQPADARRPGPGVKPRRVRIAAVAGACAGKTPDQRVDDVTRVVAPPGVRRTGDTAYVGTGLTTPTRRPPGGSRTARPKAGNRRVSKRRMGVEQGIGKLKVWRRAAERYRHPCRRQTLIRKNVAGLPNLMFA